MSAAPDNPNQNPNPDKRRWYSIKQPWSFWGWAIVLFGFGGLLVTQWMGIPLTTLLENSLSRQTLLGYVLLDEDPKEVDKRRAEERRKRWSTRLVTGEIGGAYFEIPQNYLKEEQTKFGGEYDWFWVTWPDMKPISKETDARFDWKSDQSVEGGLISFRVHHLFDRYKEGVEALETGGCTYNVSQNTYTCIVQDALYIFYYYIWDMDAHALLHCLADNKEVERLEDFAMCDWHLPIFEGVFVKITLWPVQRREAKQIRDAVIPLICSFYRPTPEFVPKFDNCTHFKETGELYSPFNLPPELIDSAASGG